MILRHDYRNIDMLHYVTGDIHASGRITSDVSKSAKQSTTNYGDRYLYARESPDVRYIQEGSAHLNNGVARINLDPIFLECVEADSELTPWVPLLTPGAPVQGLYVEQIDSTGFTVKEPTGTSNALFFWSLSAVRKGFAGIWLEEALEISKKISK